MSTQKKNGCKTNESGKEPPSKKDAKKKSRVKWVVTAFLLSFVISAVFSVAMGEVTANASIIVAILLLLFFIALGILFDVVGLAVATADASPFHSMAARKVPGAQESIRLLRNAERVSSICNDVVGDICGVVSGAASATIALQIIEKFEILIFFVSV